MNLNKQTASIIQVLNTDTFSEKLVKTKLTNDSFFFRIEYSNTLVKHCCKKYAS